MNKRKTIIIFLVIEVLALLYLYIANNGTYDSMILLLLVSLGFINGVCFFVGRKSFHLELKNHLVSTIFVAGYMIVFFQSYIDLLLGYLDTSDHMFCHQSTIIKCAIISVIGLACFVIGYLTKTHRKFQQEQEQQLRFFDTTWMKVFLVISTIVFVVFNGGKVFETGSYSQAQTFADTGTMVQYSDVFFQIFYILSVAYAVNNSMFLGTKTFKQFMKVFGWVPFVCGLVYCIIMLLIGDRGPVIVCILSFFGAYVWGTNHRLRPVGLILGIIGTAIILSLIGKTRMMDKSRGFRYNANLALTEGYEDNTVSPFTAELAGSVSSLHYSEAYVPSIYPHVYGTFIFRTLTSCIPFGDRLLFSFWRPHFRYFSSAFFVTWLIQGDDFTYGNGTSCNADLYLSFGMIGIILGLFVWGRFYNYLEMRVAWRRVTFVFAIIYLFSLGYALYVTRAYFLCYMADCIFALIINYVYQSVGNKKK